MKGGEFIEELGNCQLININLLHDLVSSL